MLFIRQSLQWFVRTVQSHPAATSFGLISASCGVAYVFCSLTLTQPPQHALTNQAMTLEQARLRAMVQMAQSSTTDERLEVIRYAQERFMLPPHHPGRSSTAPNEYEAKVEARIQTILQEDRIRRETRANDPNQIWND